ncbi:hypothetical protein GGTG_10489 [Gaeumannomyces tritici R3-111a-1]|uniref:Uncharacterized protein n=1 Tax=Gaeumannomyces tritici (strain R3-111a-1) TaxID=644352 RepID=J3PAG3_GAET3|nr:hypothetical protein GGTG_10489 [Gaeumannomyces tritici R3-111a-1]EJT71229.1 hypothetical protein GGTG_10489 [Gaeumannomyces tritici R3-111a-1]
MEREPGERMNMLETNKCALSVEAPPLSANTPWGIVDEAIDVGCWFVDRVLEEEPATCSKVSQGCLLRVKKADDAVEKEAPQVAGMQVSKPLLAQVGAPACQGPGGGSHAPPKPEPSGLCTAWATRAVMESQRPHHKRHYPSALLCFFGRPHPTNPTEPSTPRVDSTAAPALPPTPDALGPALRLHSVKPRRTKGKVTAIDSAAAQPPNSDATIPHISVARPRVKPNHAQPVPKTLCRRRETTLVVARAVDSTRCLAAP